MRQQLVALLVTLGSTATPLVARAQTYDSTKFTHITAMVPMRDGMRLNTEVYVPKSRRVAATDSLPPHPIRDRQCAAGHLGAWE